MFSQPTTCLHLQGSKGFQLTEMFMYISETIFAIKVEHLLFNAKQIMLNNQGFRISENLASFPGSRAGEEERDPGTHCSHMRQVPLVTCILLRCTKITVNSAYLLKGRTA